MDIFPESEFREALKSGDPVKQLQAIRDQLAAKMDAGICTHCGGPKGETAGMASIARELRQVLSELRDMPTGHEETELDRLRSARISRAADPDDTPYSGKSAPRKQGGRRPGGGRRVGS